MKIRLVIFLSAIFVFANFADAQSRYVSEIQKWRGAHEAELKSDDGWLTVAGLFWLKDGVNSVGAGANFDVRLTDNFKQEKFGEINFQNGAATLTIEKNIEATSGGKNISEMNLVSDENGKPTVVETGSQMFYLIKRENRFGVRLKDKNSRERQNFKRLNWFPIDKNYRVEAKFEAFKEPQEILIPNVLGGNFKMKSPGVLKFKLHGKTYSLQPVEEGEKLFIIFRDATSRAETYGGGRFLYAEKPVNGKVVLDFNRAENPPCAFTTFATCPLPPLQNRLDAAIKAGEKRYGEH